MDDRGVKLRPVESVLIASAYSALGVAIGIGALVLLTPFRSDAAFWIPTGGAFGVVFLVGLIRVSVRVSGDGLVISNVWRTHHVRWAEVAEIRHGAPWPSLAWFDFVSWLIILTVDRRRVRVQASLNTTPDEGVYRAILRELPRDTGIRWNTLYDEGWGPRPPSPPT
jgi:hypothetical protein